MGADVASFDFSSRRTMTPEELGSDRAHGVREWRRPWLALLAVGLVLMMSVYTFAVGAALVALVLFGISVPRIFRWTGRSAWHHAEHLHGEHVYRVTHDAISFRSARLSARSSWSNLRRFCLAEGRLYLFCGGMPPVVIAVAALEAAGCFDDVVALARRSVSEQKP